MSRLAFDTLGGLYGAFLFLAVVTPHDGLRAFAVMSLAVVPWFLWSQYKENKHTWDEPQKEEDKIDWPSPEQFKADVIEGYHSLTISPRLIPEVVDAITSKWAADYSKRDYPEHSEKYYKKIVAEFPPQLVNLTRGLPHLTKPLNAPPPLPSPLSQHLDLSSLQGYSLPKELSEPLHIPLENKYEGTWIVAPPRRGKTNLLLNLIADDITKGTVICLDSKGDLLDALKKYPHTLIEPKTARINPFSLSTRTHTVEFLGYIFGALLDTKLTTRQTTLFSAVLQVAVLIPNATVLTFADILLHGVEKYRQYVEKLPLKFDRDFFDPKGEFDTQYNDTKQQVLQRIRTLLQNDYFRDMFLAQTTNVDMQALMDSKGLVLIDNSKALLGEEQQEVFGRLFTAMIWMQAVQRSRIPPEQKVPVFVVIDEAHTVIKRDTKIATILEECRSQRIALTVAHQRIDQLKDTDVIGALTNCGSLIVNCGNTDAPSFAQRLNIEPDALKLPQGKFMVSVYDVTPPVVCSVKLFDPSAFPKLQTPQPKKAYTFTEGDYDTYWECTISPHVAKNGGVRKIHGIEIKIPPETKHGARFRLRGKGAYKPSGGYGDAILTVWVAQARTEPFRSLPDYGDEA